MIIGLINDLQCVEHIKPFFYLKYSFTVHFVAPSTIIVPASMVAAPHPPLYLATAVASYMTQIQNSHKGPKNKTCQSDFNNSE